MMFKNKFIKYKNKYKQLKGGSIIRIATLQDNCINQYKENEDDNSKHHCVMCNNNINISDFVILRCGCCFHHSCILKEFYAISKREELLKKDGIPCTNYSCLNKYIYITPDDIDVIINLFEDKLCDEIRVDLKKYYFGFYENYNNISTNLRNMLYNKYNN